MEEDDLKLKKETIEIEGGRKLYNYTFERLEPPPEPDKPAEPSRQRPTTDHQRP